MRHLFLLSLLLLMTVTSCQYSGTKRVQILVAPKAIASSFWLTVKAGALKAGEDRNVDVLWKGPETETDIARQISIIEDYINKDVRAIVMAACDADALVPVIARAQKSGIPVVVIDSGVNSEIPVSTVSTDNIAGGRKAAEMLAQLIGQKGKVACIPMVPGAATSIQREKGFRDGVADHPGLNLVSVQYSQSDAARGMAVTEDILTAHPDLAGIFAASEPGAIGAAQALVGRGLAGKVKLVAFDSAPNQVQALKDGSIDALIVQDPYGMGYQGVSTAVDFLNGKSPGKHIDTGVTVVTQGNLNDPVVQKLLNTK
jgi:ribose transport system substrate-binding protein